MKKQAKDPVREDRIHNEAIADANGPEEQVMGWHCYLDDKIRFPFQARCIARRIVSPLREGETVEVHRMAPEDACLTEMFVLIRWHGRVSLSLDRRTVKSKVENFLRAVTPTE
jgi:hypothetical protein